MSSPLLESLKDCTRGLLNKIRSICDLAQAPTDVGGEYQVHGVNNNAPSMSALPPSLLMMVDLQGKQLGAEFAIVLVVFNCLVSGIFSDSRTTARLAPIS